MIYCNKIWEYWKCQQNKSFKENRDIDAFSMDNIFSNVCEKNQ